MKYRYPRLMVAGIKGGSGKTTLSLGLIAALKARGLTIAPFKKGPDYIDAGWLSAAAGKPCYNLDPFLTNREKILASFTEHFRDAGLALIEGNRGLYDGMDPEGTYSTAELAKALKSPVILILDCSKVTRTAAAIVLGMQKFDQKVSIKGVVLNRTAGSRHEEVIRKAVEKNCDVPVLGAIPKLPQDFLSERHMGLTPFQEHHSVSRAIFFAAEMAKKYLALDSILDIAKKAAPLEIALGAGRPLPGRTGTSEPQTLLPGPGIRIGIIRDSAFQFYYPENFEELEKKGAKLIEVSALKEKKLPEIDALYIGGGFPETHAIALAKNTSFRKSVLTAIEKGLPVYAECGGLMYLGESLIIGSRIYPMVGVFPIKFSLEKKPQAHGYTVIEVYRKNPYYKKRTILKGHEFHYSKVINPDNVSGTGLRDNIYFAFRMKRGEGIANKMDGICYKNVLATYTHLHALGSPEWIDGMMKWQAG